MEDDERNVGVGPHWQCQECGHVRNLPMPVDRGAFYRKVAQGIIPKCPKCRSCAFMPVGY